MGRVDDLWLKADDLKFDTESDISDVSEIWSEYGDRVCPDSQPKMVRWNQAQGKKGKVLQSDDNNNDISTNRPRALARATIQAGRDVAVSGLEEEEGQEPEERFVVIRVGVSAARVHGALQGVRGERAGGRQQAAEGRAHRQARRNRGHIAGQVRQYWDD